MLHRHGTHNHPHHCNVDRWAGRILGSTESGSKDIRLFYSVELSVTIQVEYSWWLIGEEFQGPSSKHSFRIVVTVRFTVTHFANGNALTVFASTPRSRTRRILTIVLVRIVRAVLNMITHQRVVQIHGYAHTQTWVL